MKPLPDIAWLQERFAYYPRTGELRWKHRPRRHFSTDHMWRRWNTKHAHKVAGTITTVSGYRVVQGYQVSRIIWKLQTGSDPVEEIDHRDHDPLNNRWNNLREATRQQNMWNRINRNRDNLPNGVRLSDGRYEANCTTNGVRAYLGRFDTPEEAHRKYLAFAKPRRGTFLAE